MDSKSHWESVYTTKNPTEVSWYRPHLETSLGLIEEAAGGHAARIIDVGGGESMLLEGLSAASCAQSGRARRLHDSWTWPAPSRGTVSVRASRMAPFTA